MVDFTLTDEQQDLRDLAHSFAEKDIRPVAWEYDVDGTWPQDVIEKAWEVGLMNTHIPEAYGGPGLDYLSGCLIEEEMGWGCSGIGTSLMANGLAAALVALGGTEEIKNKYLGMLTEEPKLASFCLTEPDAGSDVSGMKTTAVKQGDMCVINGSKCFITNGAVRRLVHGLREDRHGGRPPAASAPSSSGATPPASLSTRRRTRWASGHRTPRPSPSTTTEILADEPPRRGEQGLQAGDDDPRPHPASAWRPWPSVIARAALRVRRRVLGGARPVRRLIAMHQAIQFMIADMATKVEAARLPTWYSAVDARPGPAQHAWPPRWPSASQPTRRWRSATDAVQVYGGYGFIKEYPVEKLMRDAKIPVFVERLGRSAW